MKDLIKKIYQSALFNADIDLLLREISDKFHATDVHIIVYGDNYDEVLVNHIAYNKDSEVEFSELFLNPGTNPAIEYFRNNPKMNIAQDSDFGPDVFGDFHDFYEYVDRRDAFYRIGHRFLDNELQDGSMWILRDKKIGLANNSELRNINSLSHHIRIAVDLLSRAAVAGRPIIDIFDSLETPAILVEKSLRVIEMNKKAQTDLMNQEFLFIRNRNLRMAFGKADDTLKNGVRFVTDRWADAGSAEAIVNDASRSIAYRVRFVPVLSPGLFLLPSERLALILFDEIRVGNLTISKSAIEYFGLTRAEADTASAISCGMTLPEIAKIRRISVETVRTQARTTREKLGARRNIDLARIFQKLEK